MITIVDYGVGNIGALVNMFDFLGYEARLADDAQGITSAECLVLPGIGAFDKAMQTLRDRTLIEPLTIAVQNHHTPVLGVCLGMQLLARSSEEGTIPGLGWIQADVRRIVLPDNSPFKVPHIGWADVATAISAGTLFSEPGPNEGPERFYFNHSYHMVCDDPKDVAATIEYGQSLCCAVRRGHVAGVQFHPEKSHRFGMRLLSEWARMSQAGLRR